MNVFFFSFQTPGATSVPNLSTLRMTQRLLALTSVPTPPNRPSNVPLLAPSFGPPSASLPTPSFDGPSSVAAASSLDSPSSASSPAPSPEGLLGNASRSPARPEAPVTGSLEPVASTTGLVTLRSFAPSWLERKVLRGDIEKLTADRYATSLDRLSVRLLDTPVAQLGPADVEAWLLAARKEGFAPRTVNAWKAVLGTVLADAGRELGLTRNVAREVRSLRVPPNLEEPNALRPAELRALLAVLRRDAHRLLYLAALTQAFTGLRWGEVSALRWEDLDREERVLLIRRKACRGELVPSTKTGKARLVGVPDLLLAELDAHRKWVDEVGPPGSASGLIFFSKVGTPLASARISGALRAAREEAGILARFTSHGLRRTLTDLLRRARVDPVIAKSLVGHATDRMREHYSSVLPDEARETAERVSALLFDGVVEGPSGASGRGPSEAKVAAGSDDSAAKVAAGFG